MDLADWAARGHRAGVARLHRNVEHGWHEDYEGFCAGVTEIPAPPFNGVSVYGDHDPAELREALGRIAASGLPFSLQTRAAQTESVAELAASLRMERQNAMPLMVTTSPPPALEVPGLALREIAPEEAEIHAALAAEAFEAPLELMRRLTVPALFSPPDVYALVGFWAGAPATTALVNMAGDVGGILDVATRSAHRGRGFGAAVTAATVRRGFAAGAGLCFLLSTPMGVGVYESLGFTALERWTSWMGLPGA